MVLGLLKSTFEKVPKNGTTVRTSAGYRKGDERHAAEMFASTLHLAGPPSSPPRPQLLGKSRSPGIGRGQVPLTYKSQKKPVFESMT